MLLHLHFHSRLNTKNILVLGFGGPDIRGLTAILIVEYHGMLQRHGEVVLTKMGKLKPQTSAIDLKDYVNRWRNALYKVHMLCDLSRYWSINVSMGHHYFLSWYFRALIRMIIHIEIKYMLALHLVIWQHAAVNSLWPVRCHESKIY